MAPGSTSVASSCDQLNVDEVAMVCADMSEEVSLASSPPYGLGDEEYLVISLKNRQEVLELMGSYP
jgi:hypothetical protein